MSAHAIAAEIRQRIRAYRRARRCGDAALEHEAKDTFCAELEAGIDRLVRAIGTPALLSLRTGVCPIGGRVVQVVTRDRVAAASPTRRPRGRPGRAA